MRNQFKCMVQALISFAAILASYANAADVASTVHNLSTPSNSTTEICVFCHTPHASNTDLIGPLWNRTNTETYTMYGGTSMTMEAGSTPGDSSLICLSCHDGTQSMDSIINAPGSGLSKDGDWTADRTMSGIAVLGTNLADDHPIGIPYCGGDNGSGGCVDPDFSNPGLRNTFVECASCHDPHLDNPLFLRYSDGNAGSQVCFSCHTK